jgi:hypothetical protein
LRRIFLKRHRAIAYPALLALLATARSQAMAVGASGQIAGELGAPTSSAQVLAQAIAAELRRQAWIRLCVGIVAALLLGAISIETFRSKGSPVEMLQARNSAIATGNERAYAAGISYQGVDQLLGVHVRAECVLAQWQLQEAVRLKFGDAAARQLASAFPVRQVPASALRNVVMDANRRTATVTMDTGVVTLTNSLGAWKELVPLHPENTLAFEQKVAKLSAIRQNLARYRLPDEVFAAIAEPVVNP